VRLFSYVVRWDTGAAPNPFGGVCTLAICKPGIRRSAGVGDWIVGFASNSTSLERAGDRVVFAMKVTGKLPWPAYDALCRSRLALKIPDVSADDPRRVRGDCQYDFGRPEPVQRPGQHGPASMATDLSAPVLLSDRFRYYGRKARLVPSALGALAPHGRGFRSHANDSLVDRFMSWFERISDSWNVPLGVPIEWSEDEARATIPPELARLERKIVAGLRSAGRGDLIDGPNATARIRRRIIRRRCAR